MAYYGVDGSWRFSSGGFVGHVKLMFIRGTDLEPAPPVTPIGMGKSTRGLELANVKDLDEHPLASWMKQAATTLAERRSDDHRRATVSALGLGVRDDERLLPRSIERLRVFG